MIRLKATKDHLIELLHSCDEPSLVGRMTDDAAEKINGFEYAFSAVDVYGKIWAMAGLVKDESDEWEAWAIMDTSNGSRMFGVTRLVAEFLETFDGGDVKAWVNPDFLLGHKWVRMLGFKEKAPSSAHDGGSQGDVLYILYADKRS